MKTFKIQLLLLTFISFSLKFYGQKNIEKPIDTIPVTIIKTKSLTLISGYQFNSGHYAEVGIGIKDDYLIGNKKSNFTYVLSNELKVTENFIWGLKAGVWTEGGIKFLSMGFNLVNYTDFNNTQLCFRPEIGLGYGMFRLVYGFNYGLTNSNLEGVDVNNIGITFKWKLKKLKEEEKKERIETHFK